MKVYILAAMIALGLATAFVSSSFFPEAIAATDN